MSDHVELKYLTRRLEDAKSALRVLKDERSELDNKIRKEQETVTRLDKEIGRLKSSNTGKAAIVSEHALLRYFERVLNFDLDKIKRDLMPEGVEKAIKTMGSGTFPTTTHRLKVKNGIVVTVLTDDDKE